MIQTLAKRTEATKALAMSLLVAVTMAACLMLASPAHATTFTVNNNGDQPDIVPDDDLCVADTFGTFECTLRAAIQQANATPGADRINFNLELQNIRPNSPLPFIRNQTIIDGYTQPSSSPNTLQAGNNARIGVELDGTNAGSESGLVFAASGSGDSPSSSVVQGLAINNFARNGIGIFGSLGIRIEGNFIGTDTSGTQDRGNGESGVLIRERSTGDGSGLHVVGDDSPASRNVISGNDSHGVCIMFGSGNNKVKGNYIGTDKDGTDNLTNDDLGNDGSGVFIDEANNNEVGGATAGQGNVISNNDNKGVQVSGGSLGNKVLGNRIGTDRTGKKDLGNFGDGVSVLDAANNFIGNNATGGANTIAFNSGAGVAVLEGGDGIPNNTNANRILRNRIFSNESLGIALGNGSTPTPNDGDDPATSQPDPDKDVGPNGLQNKPLVSSAKTSSTKTTVAGKLNSTPGKTFTVRFFSNPPGGDEGKMFLGQKRVSTDVSGNVPFTKALPRVAVGKTITATATGAGGNTSEFSAARKVAAS